MIAQWLNFVLLEITYCLHFHRTLSTSLKTLKFKEIFRFSFPLLDGGLGTGTTISSRWPPVGAGPTLGPAEPNGGGIDAKHLDVGDMSDVSDVSFDFIDRIAHEIN